ncbi:hypothetical protein [Mycolicibacterium gadium]|uniref:Uncharacterized protein n=1 Tax=Mycolicibacterium gadium TaxID=1794 RepID=A0A7I7WR57_MYCGU|nr:hypothetical protein [Mycolicibacterium gadium]BBZ19041.1 hypothetical protein MGAD_33760 [Mycolicibacterium gadium]
MSQSDDEWLVDVEGPNVVVTVKSGSQTERRVLGQHQTRVLREQLRLADLLARRNRWVSGSVPSPIEDAAGDFSISGVRVQPATLDGPAPRPTVPADDDADSGELLEQMREERGRAIDGSEDDDAQADVRARRLEAIRLTSGALDEVAKAYAEGLAPLDDDDAWARSARAGMAFPGRWEIRAEGNGVFFSVPGSAVDGEFHLTSSEALAVGVLMIQVSQRQWAEKRLNDSQLRELQSRLLRVTRYEELLEVIGRGWNEMASQSASSDAYEIRIVPSPAQGNDIFEAWHSSKPTPLVSALAFRGAWLLYVDPEVAEVVHDPVSFTGMKIESRLAALDWVDTFAQRYVSVAESIPRTTGRDDEAPDSDLETDAGDQG